MPLYVNVICSGSPAARNYGGKEAYNWNYGVDPGTESQKAMTNVLLTPAVVFFVLVTVFGIASVISFILAGWKRYMVLLRCAGLKRSRGVRMFLLQGLALFFGAALLGTGLALVFLGAIFGVSRLAGKPLVLRLSPASLALSYALAALAVFVPLLAMLLRFFKKSPLETGSKARKKERRGTADRLEPLWAGAVRRAYRAQNITAALLAMFCMGITVFGSFVSVFGARTLYSYTPQDHPADVDYELYVGGGGSSGADFHITYPRTMGISAKSMQALYQTGGLGVTSATIYSMTSQQLLLRKGEENPFLNFCADEDAGGSGILENSRSAQVVAQAGGGPDDRLVVPHLTGLDYHTVQNKYPSFSGGSLSKEGFQSGREVIGPDSLCRVGDEYTLITPVPQGEFWNSEDGPAPLDFCVTKVRVAATYAAAEKARPLILSAEFITATDPTARYDIVDLENQSNGDAAVTAHIEDTLEAVVAKSENLRLNNLYEKDQSFTDYVRGDQIRTIVSVAVFLAAVLLACALSTYVKVRGSLHSYVLMQALGAKQSTLRRMLNYETLHTLIFGGSLGTLLGLGITAYFAISFIQVPSWDIYLFYVLPSALVVFGLLCGLSLLAIRKPFRSLLNRSISEELNSLEL